MRLHSGHPRADGKESHKLTERAKENLYKSRTWGDRFGSVNDKCGTVLREIVENEGRMREEGGEIRGGGENRGEGGLGGGGECWKVLEGEG